MVTIAKQVPNGAACVILMTTTLWEQHGVSYGRQTNESLVHELFATELVCLQTMKTVAEVCTRVKQVAETKQSDNNYSEFEREQYARIVASAHREIQVTFKLILGNVSN